MPLPEGYLPRQDDELLIRVKVSYDCDDGESDVHIRLVGAEHKTAVLGLSSIHALHLRNWRIGDTISYPSLFEGPAEVLAIDGHEVWVRDTENQRWTIEANELEAYVEPAPDALTVTPISGEVKIGDTITGAGNPYYPDDGKIVAVLPPSPPAVDAASIGDDDMPI
jgi:hypothetical protein